VNGENASWNVRIMDDAEAVAREARARIEACARRCIAADGAFRLVLAGGTTPLAVYRDLARRSPDTSGWEIFFGDERCLTPEHADRNSRAARQAWLDASGIPASRIHVIPAEFGPREGAVRYAREIERWQPFDLVLLGMGEDGHVASLFPGHAHPEADAVVGVTGAPKPPPERVSLNYATICAARERLLIVTGSAKRDAVSAWQQGAMLPVTRVAECGAGTVLLDRAAAPV
jgi:6-phosphogluconolactonase